MTDRPAIEQTLAGGAWCDVELHGISWSEGGRDLALALRLPSAATDEGPNRLLHARWVTELATTLSFAERTGGYPLTWDVHFEQDAAGGWLVRFDFAGVGELRFRCASVDLLPRAPVKSGSTC